MPGSILNPDIKIGCYYFQIAGGVRTGNILWITNIDQARGLYICDLLQLHDCKVYTDKQVPAENIDSSCIVPEEIKQATAKKMEEKIKRSLERRIAEIKKFFK